MPMAPLPKTFSALRLFRSSSSAISLREREMEQPRLFLFDPPLLLPLAFYNNVAVLLYADLLLFLLCTTLFSNVTPITTFFNH